MRTKSVLAACALAVVAMSPAMADYAAGTVDVTRVAGYYDTTYSGGEFTLYNSILITSGYASTTKNVFGGANSFQTFCMERSEHILPPPKANVTVSTTFINEATGAVTGPGSHAVLGSMTYGDNLDARTAYLYTMFAKGTLAGYNYTPGALREASAKDLQNAIWFIEGEGGANNAFVTAANTAVASGGAWYNKGIGSVRVLNLWTLDGNGAVVRNQDMLWLVPAPGAALLAFFGLGVIGWVKRRMA